MGIRQSGRCAKTARNYFELTGDMDTAWNLLQEAIQSTPAGKRPPKIPKGWKEYREEKIKEPGERDIS